MLGVVVPQRFWVGVCFYELLPLVEYHVESEKQTFSSLALTVGMRRLCAWAVLARAPCPSRTPLYRQLGLLCVVANGAGTARLVQVWVKVYCCVSERRDRACLSGARTLLPPSQR